MNYSKRSDGRRLLVVIALFGILSTYGISAQNDQVSDAAPIEESSEPTTATAAAAAAAAGDQSADGGLTTAAATTSEAEKLTETSVGETATQPGGSLPGGTSDEQAGSTVGGSSIAGVDGTVEISTSDGKSSTAEGVSVRTGSDATGVESSRGGTEGGTTATVREAPSATGSTGTEKQITEGETTAAFTGATSPDGKEDEPVRAVQLQETTVVANAEENTTSVVQTSKAADAQYTTNVGDTSAERQTDTPAPVKVTVVAVSSTLAPIGCNSTSTCETCKTLKANRNRLSLNASICKAETDVSNTFQYCVTIELHNQENPSASRTYTDGSPHNVNCSDVLDPIEEKIRMINNRIRSRTTTTPSIPTERKRRQADENLEWNDADIDELWDAVRIVVKNVTSARGENSSPALPSSPQSTESLAESSTASDTTSTVLTSTSTVSAKAEDLNAAGCNSTNICETCETLKANKGRLSFNASICKAETGVSNTFQYCVTIEIHDQRNASLPRTETNGSPHKINCSTVLGPIKEKIRTIISRIRGRTTPSAPSNKRKRRQADDDEDVEWDDADIDELWETARIVVKNVTSTSSENDDSTKAKDPNAVKEPTQTPKPNVWDAHRGIFVTVAILLSVCVVVTAFCCLCMKWRERGGSKNPEKHPIAMEEAREAPTAVSNPITDREMIQDEAPMQERENPAVTPNGGGQHISKADEDNGWVVPLDELSNAEKEKPEVENTRL